MVVATVEAEVVVEKEEKKEGGDAGDKASAANIGGTDERDSNLAFYPVPSVHNYFTLPHRPGLLLLSLCRRTVI